MSTTGPEDGFIRPFVITGGRTAHRTDLQLDTLLSAAPARRPRQLGFEHRAVIALCEHPISIAELATSLDLPVGVITVVVDDLLEAEQVVVHRNRSATVSADVLERILNGVRAL
ncbi:DUF742 domain-containing protein [Aquihabitans sp. G128]|uniref:DUF742 domain-containing protein n=1 Tax=Aquihabitans sp. G128 TaxID=2849779 RepID=UPI001C2303BA|nr:DUF742 domain-containing protein [Aquihabitans sp. G128]QXC61650.1 DUF742 domain-containing protein [Aquihabitans sp. G128]